MSKEQPTQSRVLIIGAGQAGQSLGADIEAGGDCVVGFLDDALSSNRVLGKLDDLESVAERYQVNAVYFAIPSANPNVVRDFVGRARLLNLDIAIIPRTYRIVSRDRVSVADLTDVDVLDFVGRAPIKHDMELAESKVRGKKVLVTGAAGSIGSRIITQLASMRPASIIALDRAESSMFHLERNLREYDNITFEIGDVQSAERISQIMERFRPDYVFHVAAYKHVPLMQSYPIEAFNNNVWGTLNVLQSAAIAGAERVVYVSTDKAVNPTNVMGATKRLGELLLHDLSDKFPSTVFAGVRFGNVLESEGSVMQVFRRQLHENKNLTVTHKDITRFFMTIDEAAQLVIQCASLAKHDDLFVLDMGDPIRVYDLATSLITAVNPSLGVDIIGLRPGEKMFEELSYDTSEIDATSHAKILIVREDIPQKSGRTLSWVEETLQSTRAYQITGADLVERLRQFGFGALQQ